EAFGDAAQFESQRNLLTSVPGCNGTDRRVAAKLSRGRAAARILPTETSLRGSGRFDLDRARDDVLLQLVDLGLQRRVDLAVELVVRGERDAVVGERAHVA